MSYSLRNENEKVMKMTIVELIEEIEKFIYEKIEKWDIIGSKNKIGKKIAEYKYIIKNYESKTNSFNNNNKYILLNEIGSLTLQQLANNNKKVKEIENENIDLTSKLKKEKNSLAKLEKNYEEKIKIMKIESEKKETEIIQINAKNITLRNNLKDLENVKIELDENLKKLLDEKEHNFREINQENIKKSEIIKGFSKKITNLSNKIKDLNLLLDEEREKFIYSSLSLNSEIKILKEEKE